MIKPLVNMSAHEGRDGKRFLEGLILRAEDVLAKMIYKVHKNLVTLDEMVPMINSVYGFVNTWEKSLADINLDLVVAGGSKSNETSVMEQINKLDFKDRAVEKKPEKGSRKKHSLKDEEEAEPVFEYLEPSLKDYTPDRKGIAVITHAIPGSASFYMVEREDSNKVEQVLLSLQNVTTQLAELPESSSTVFGVSLDNQIFRAVRSTAGFCGIPFLRLLDTGEVLPYIDTMPIFKLPEYYQRFAPFAVRCNLIGVMDEPSCKNFTKYLEKNLYVTKQFKVCSRKKSTLNVSLGRVPQSKRNGKVQPRKPEVTPEYKISEKTLTQEQLDILYEETECTSNAMKATMGFIPKDDERICPFYDPQIEGCFKGSRCRLRHEAKDPDGWTKDRAFHKLKIRAHMIEPQIGQVLKMVPTAIVSMEEFYGQLYSTQSVKELSELQNRLNDPEVVKKLRRMDHTPYAREYVFAMFHQDGQWYRAEVMEYIHDGLIHVFYLDYGNYEKVQMNDLRLWDDGFDFVPFQAIHCRLANVRRKEGTEDEATIALKDAILDKQVSIKVSDIRSNWEVYVFDARGKDVGQVLVDMKVVFPRQPIVFDDEEGLVPA